MLYKATVFNINVVLIKLSANIISYTIVSYNVDFQCCMNPDSFNVDQCCNKQIHAYISMRYLCMIQTSLINNV